MIRSDEEPRIAIKPKAAYTHTQAGNGRGDCGLGGQVEFTIVLLEGFDGSVDIVRDAGRFDLWSRYTLLRMLLNVYDVHMISLGS